MVPLFSMAPVTELLPKTVMPKVPPEMEPLLVMAPTIPLELMIIPGEPPIMVPLLVMSPAVTPMALTP